MHRTSDAQHTDGSSRTISVQMLDASLTYIKSAAGEVSAQVRVPLIKGTVADHVLANIPAELSEKAKEESIELSAIVGGFSPSILIQCSADMCLTDEAISHPDATLRIAEDVASERVLRFAESIVSVLMDNVDMKQLTKTYTQKHMRTKQI